MRYNVHDGDGDDVFHDDVFCDDGGDDGVLHVCDDGGDDVCFQLFLQQK